MVFVRERRSIFTIVIPISTVLFIISHSELIIIIGYKTFMRFIFLFFYWALILLLCYSFLLIFNAFLIRSSNDFSEEGIKMAKDIINSYLEGKEVSSYSGDLVTAQLWDIFKPYLKEI